ncbi:MAG: hypothetical protein ACP5RH_20400, partial [Leptodesmis sp.]|uniref:hypothetical protein n=1 Tax=Leptodesmis sp. TaxID=3100501 RepID=UPI003D095D32
QGTKPTLLTLSAAARENLKKYGKGNMSAAVEAVFGETAIARSLTLGLLTDQQIGEHEGGDGDR